MNSRRTSGAAFSTLDAAVPRLPYSCMSIEITQSSGTPNVRAAKPDRSVSTALTRGAAQRCPACGTGKLFSAYLKVADTCPACTEPLHHHQADDAPAYFTIFIVGHIIVGGALALEQSFAPATWVHTLLWLQWALRMHGFATSDTPSLEGSASHGESAKQSS